jgi:hypothetical protein
MPEDGRLAEAHEEAQPNSVATNGHSPISVENAIGPSLPRIT